MGSRASQAADSIMVARTLELCCSLAEPQLFTFFTEGSQEERGRDHMRERNGKGDKTVAVAAWFRPSDISQLQDGRCLAIVQHSSHKVRGRKILWWFSGGTLVIGGAIMPCWPRFQGSYNDRKEEGEQNRNETREGTNLALNRPINY